ncbi:MAG: hypothetical protein AAF411_01975 [Myxococcota bacterium]
MRKPLWLGCALALACSSSGSLDTTMDAGVADFAMIDSATPPPERDRDDEPEPVQEGPLGAERTLAIGRYIAPVLLGRDLREDEAEQLRSSDGDAWPEVIDGWTGEEGLARGARRFIERTVRVSGDEARGIDYGMPGRIVERVARRNLPWGEILTHGSCVNAEGEDTECDTGAPYTAGILTTRSFLATTVSRFNLGRASALAVTFLCEDYPIPSDIQPYLNEEDLIPLFRANSEEDLEGFDPESVGGLANGAMCFTCHGQFAAHAQLFVRFDQQGMYQADATGLQNPDGMPGESFNGLMASHMIDELAPLESTQMLGEDVANLTEAAEVLVAHPEFNRCTVQRMLEETLPLEPGSLDRDLTERVRDLLGGAPTYIDFVRETFSYPRLVRTLGDALIQAGGPSDG